MWDLQRSLILTTNGLIARDMIEPANLNRIDSDTILEDEF